MRLRSSRPVAVALTAAAGLAVALLAAACSQATRSGPDTATARSGAAGTAGFGWLRARPAPAGWARAGLPGQAAVLWYPRWLVRQQGDAGTVTEGLVSPAGAVQVYLNVTPRQGGETLAAWDRFRVAHLREDGDTAVRLDARSPDVAFRGGRGRCVIDDYTTRVGANRYREIACCVQAGRGGSVLVAATRAAGWGAYGGVLEKVISAYQAG